MRTFSLTFALLTLLTVPSIVAAQALISASPEHIEMAREVGTWDAETKFWMTPNADPVTSKGVETNEMFGDFWLISKFKGDIGGAPFEGRMQLGYDPVEKKYVGTWIDTMTPYVSRMSGNYDVESHTLKLVSKARDPQSGEIKTSTMVSKYIDADTKEFTMYDGGPDEEDPVKMMQITYKRRK